MKNTYETLEKIAHFLCVNSEAIKSKGLQGQMSLIYFFFSYGKQLELQHYMDFALEILEYQLAEVFSQFHAKNDNTAFDLNLIEVGWSLQKYVAMEFFESDELDEILLPFDKMAQERIESLTNEQLSVENLFTLILIMSYWQERWSGLGEGFANSARIKNQLEYLRMLLEKSMDLIKEFPNFLLLANGLIQNNQNKYQMQLSQFLLGEYPFSEQQQKSNNNKLASDLIKKMLALYKKQEKNFEENLLKIALGGSMVMDNKTIVQQEYLAYSIIFQHHENQSN